MSTLDSFLKMLGWGGDSNASVPQQPIALPAYPQDKKVAAISPAPAAEDDETDEDSDLSDEENASDKTNKAIAEAKANGDLTSGSVGDSGKAVAVAPPPITPQEAVQASAAQTFAQKLGQPAPPQSVPETQASVSDTIKKLIGENSISPEQLAQAQNEGRHQRLISALGKGANLIGASIASGGSYNAPIKHDESVYNDIEKNADLPLKELKAKQDMLGEKLKQSELATKLLSDSNKSDPTKPISVFMRNFAKTLGLEVPDNVSAAEIEKMLPGIEGVYNKKYLASAAAGKQNDKVAQHATDQEKKYYSELLKTANSSRGDTEVQQALRARYLVNNALKLINEYPDPDHLSKKQVNLLVTELGKIASGGVPGQHELQELAPNTPWASLSDLAGRIVGDPQHAGLGNFVKQYASYLHGLRENATDTLRNKYQKNADSYFQGKLINEDQFNTFKHNFIENPDLSNTVPANKSKLNIQGSYDNATEKGIAAVMQHNNVSREEAVSALKAAGKING